DSAYTKEFFRIHYPPCSPGSFYLGAEEYQRYFRGWEYVLQNASLDYQIIQDGDVTWNGLAPYRLLILSNTASLSDAQITAVKRWVKKGGRLLATFGSGYKDIISTRAKGTCRPMRENPDSMSSGTIRSARSSARSRSTRRSMSGSRATRDRRRAWTDSWSMTCCPTEPKAICWSSSPTARSRPWSSRT